MRRASLAPFLIAVGIVCLLGIACGSSASKPTPTAIGVVPTQAKTLVEPNSEPPHVLSPLPEGKLLVREVSETVPNYPSIVIEGSVAATASIPVTVAGDDALSPDMKYMLHWERPAGGAEPTAIVVRRADGSEAFRLAPVPRTTYPAWAPADDRIAYQAGQTVYIRNVDTGSQIQFEVAEDAALLSWVADGSKLVLLRESSTATPGATSYGYVVDTTSGTTENIPWPFDSGMVPDAQFTTISPDGRYLSYPVSTSSPHYDLWMMEIATGRTCLLMKDAPSHQYPERAQWSPNSRWLTYAAKYEFDQIGFQGVHAVDLATCADYAVGPENGGEPIWSPDSAFLTIATQGATVSQFAYTVLRPDNTLVKDGLNHPPVWARRARAFASIVANGVLVFDADVDTSREYPVHTFSDVQSTGILWSPGERYLLVYGHSSTNLRSTAGAEMYVLDRQTGSVTALVDEQREFTPTAWLP